MPAFRAALVLVCTAGALYELGEWRLRRSNDAVALARYLRTAHAEGGVAFEQLWRAGGPLYLSPRAVRIDVPDEEIEDILQRRDLSWLALKIDIINRYQHGPALVRAGWRREREVGEYILFRR